MSEQNLDFNIEPYKGTTLASRENFEKVVELRAAIATMLIEIDETLDGQVKAAYKAYKTANDKKKEMRQPWEEKDAILKALTDRYATEVEKPKLTNVTYRTITDFSIYDMDSFLDFVIDNNAFDLIKLNNVAVKRVIKGMSIPGVEKIQKVSTTVKP